MKSAQKTKNQKNSFDQKSFEIGFNKIDGKYKIRIISILVNNAQPMRFNEVVRSLKNVSLKKIAATLKELVADDILSRTVYAQIPPKVEYALTENGKNFTNVIKSLCDWANNLKKTPKSAKTESSSTKTKAKTNVISKISNTPKITKNKAILTPKTPQKSVIIATKLPKNTKKTSKNVTIKLGDKSKVSRKSKTS